MMLSDMWRSDLKNIINDIKNHPKTNPLTIRESINDKVKWYCDTLIDHSHIAAYDIQKKKFNDDTEGFVLYVGTKRQLTDQKMAVLFVGRY